MIKLMSHLLAPIPYSKEKDYVISFFYMLLLFIYLKGKREGKRSSICSVTLQKITASGTGTDMSQVAIAPSEFPMQVVGAQELGISSGTFQACQQSGIGRQVAKCRTSHVKLVMAVPGGGLACCATTPVLVSLL